MAKLLLLLFCMMYGAHGKMSEEKKKKFMVKHFKSAQKFYLLLKKELPKDFSWLKKSKVATSLGAEIINTMNEGCFTGCAASSYHKDVCEIDGDKIFPLIYGPLLKKGASKKDVCDSSEDEDNFSVDCYKHCSQNTQMAVLMVLHEAQRIFEKKPADGLQSEEGEEAGKEEEHFPVGPSTTRLYETDEEVDMHGFLAELGFSEKTKNGNLAPLAAAVMITSLVIMLGMGRTIYSLRKRVAVAEGKGSCDVVE